MSKSAGLFALCALLLVSATWPSRANGQSVAPKQAGDASAQLSFIPELDRGFHELYELKFKEARARFTAWEGLNPTAPLGPALEAAADLFEEFYRKGVLTSEFFLNDKRLLGGIEGKPDADLETSFAAAAQRSENLARQRLAVDPNDADALFALTLSAGMRSDNASLLEKKQMESLGFMREADVSAKKLLAVTPEADDAYLALGAANYIIGILPGYKRALLRMGGVRGDRTAGIEQLQRAAASGHYLRPYAKLMLALAELREKHPDLARAQLEQLAAEFPDNPLFGAELAKAAAAANRNPPPGD
jgi:hypothetical protein